MKLALVNDERCPASPGLTGLCPSCGAVLIAKCGTERVYHWSHKAVRMCDAWWEPETEWHRRWKDRFPFAWQEVILKDVTGEKHISDVRTDKGLTIEFQHSHLKPGEKAAREQFYGNMIWVVDGTRLSRDLPRFLENHRDMRNVGQGIYITPFPDEIFPKQWLACCAPVLFDFRGDVSADDSDIDVIQSLWCLLPGRAHERAVILRVSPDGLVKWAHGTDKPVATDQYLAEVTKLLEVERARQMQLEHAHMMRTMVRRPRPWNPKGFSGRKRRF